MKKSEPAKPPDKYVAFLRGINVGGHTVKMADLKKAFEALGFENVRMILASGNIVFDAAGSDRIVLMLRIEEILKKRWGFDVPVVLRAAEDLRALISATPFKGIEVTPATRLYITFLGEKAATTAKLPYVSPEKDVRIFRVSSGDAASVLTLSPSRRGHTVPSSASMEGPGRGTTDLMAGIEKFFGKDVTTRNWNTLKKLPL
jgi:uncharacterized protein (DUF1697 family)